MKYLLDTHTFLWYINDDELLSGKANKAITNPTVSSIYVSIASMWEIAIKLNIGKIELNFPFTDLYKLNNFELLPINFQHTSVITTLDKHHNDPFDRIIIAQALTDNLVVISKDNNFAKYKNLHLLW